MTDHSKEYRTTETGEFYMSPRNIQSLVVNELGAKTERVTKEKPYTEMFGVRTSNANGLGNTAHIVKRDGTLEALDDGSILREHVDAITDGALVMEYYSSKGNTFKIYLGKEVAEIAPKSAASILLDDEA